ncbi:phosphoribosylglycinamide formyltransferase [Methanoplanus endosymbiosus]|uniref:phosphoribosylglycinamide formyltransferase 1 n=1 Tax=Methanoplanus endosymbiosus TaxID=33865 RepID=A0A9E7TIP6_9EURY|nr:phosphoribosylglycinamide formyltransferase [Methanoplanus endosymbiosus]UUX92773.1 phosphoribosylglycinamide formyltransferase [Methanoplanus endosymbiosus]
MMKKIAFLASGRGSNFQAVIDRVNDGTINAEIVALITDKPDAYAIKRAGENNIPVFAIDFKSFGSRDDYNAELLRVMKEINADLYVLAGYMRLLDPDTAACFSGRMINIHPALLPSFKGLNAQKQAIEYGVRISGCTVHFVDEGMDSGAIILQHSVPVLDNDDEMALADRILKEEHAALPEAVKLFCEDKISISKRRVIIKE